MKQFSFKIKGHKNVLSTHKSTLEFTQDTDLTLNGDCILGVSASKTFESLDKKSSKVKHNKKVSISLSTPDKKYTDVLSGYYNDNFNSKNELVIRKSDFIDYRTFITKSNKSAFEINKYIVKFLKKESNNVNVTIKPTKIKNIIFDFDNTLEEWQKYEDEGDLFLSEMATQKFNLNISKNVFAKQFRTSKEKYISHKTQPKYYGRDVWLRDALYEFSVKYTKHDIELLTSLYWDYIIERVKLFPNTKQLLNSLSKNYKLYILSDSDGNIDVKNKRIDKFDIRKYFKGIYTSDETGWNKPHIKCYNWLLEKTKLNPHETIFVGDHPETDLITSKELGMTTVWIKKGEYAKKQKYNYVDFEINEITELRNILKFV